MSPPSPPVRTCDGPTAPGRLQGATARYAAALMLCAGFTHGFVYARCAPALIGQDCATAGVASQPAAEAALSLSLGNPIHLATGNKYQQSVDLPDHPAAPG